MSIVVEHDKRRREILERALDVFMEDGYEDTTFQKIADRCGITRTTLYLYYRNKLEIFNWSIKQLMAEVEGDIVSVKSDAGLTAREKLEKVLGTVLDRLQENRRLLIVVMNYLMHLAKSGNDPDYRVRRRTIRFRHILATIVIDGIRAGELPPVNVRVADDLLYGLIESAIFRLVVLGRPSAAELKGAMQLAVERLSRGLPPLSPGPTRG